jgi:hemerythrin
MKWSERYATGLAHIDNQHKTIFAMSEDYRSALDEGRGEVVYPELLESLALYIRTHFGQEEACMERYRCPLGQANASAHGKFTAVLRGFQERYVANGYERSEAYRLVDTIDQWLNDHICRIDVQLKSYVG